MDLIADAIFRFAEPQVGRQIIGSYDRFLAAMRDPESREKLKRLPFEQADDPFFEKQRQITREFRDGLEKLFFDSNKRLIELTKRYGVF